MHKCSILFSFVTCLLFAHPAFGQTPQKAVTPAPATSLQDTINAALRYHSGLKVMQENREVVIHELRRAKAGWGPRVDATSRTGVNQLSDSTSRSQNHDTGMYGTSRVGIVLVQPLWDGFATRSRVRTAEATVDSMTSRVFDNATTYALDGIIAHIDMNRRREILRLAEENVRRHEEILTSSRDRQSLGADTMADVTQTEGRLARALSTLAEAKAAMREGEASYRRLTGMSAPAALEPVTLPDSLYAEPESILTAARQHNPKLLAYLDDIKAAVGSRELSEAAFHPTVDLEVGPNYSDRSGTRNQWVNSFDVVLSARWNLFNSGADEAATKASVSRVRMARQVLYNFADDLTLEIQNTWTGYTTAIEQNMHYEDAIRYNTQTRDSYLEQFLVGQRSLLDVLDAESELFNSSTQAVTAKGNILVGGYRMMALSGVLLPDLGIDTKPLYDAVTKNDTSSSGWTFSNEDLMNDK